MPIEYPQFDERPDMVEDLVRADYYKLYDVFGDDKTAKELLAKKYHSLSVVQISNIVTPNVVPDNTPLFHIDF